MAGRGAGTCPRCGGRLVERSGPGGRFVGCSGYPRCRHTRPLPAASGRAERTRQGTPLLAPVPHAFALAVSLSLLALAGDTASWGLPPWAAWAWSGLCVAAALLSGLRLVRSLSAAPTKGGPGKPGQGEPPIGAGDGGREDGRLDPAEVEALFGPGARAPEEARQVPPGEPVEGVAGVASTPGEERLARLVHSTLRDLDRERPRVFANWLGRVEGRSTQVDCIAVMDRVVAVFEHKDLRPKRLFMNGGDADWVGYYGPGRSYPTSNPVSQNDAHLWYLRKAYPSLDYVSLVVVADGTPSDARLPLVVDRDDGTQRAIIRERHVPALLRGLAGTRASAGRADAAAELWGWLLAADESGDPEAVAAHERRARAARARRQAAAGRRAG